MHKVTIKPVTRIEGHAKIDIFLDEKGKVKDTYFCVEELRGFEKFLQGRKVWEAPRLTARICGICPVVHHLASAKACDSLFGVELPETAILLRELMHMGQLIHSHSLHFFFLALPDFILQDPASRNLIGIAKKDIELTKRAIKLRGIGQKIIRTVGGKSIHPVAAVPGGMARSLSPRDREAIEGDLKEALELNKTFVDSVKEMVEKNMDLFKEFADIKTSFIALNKNGDMEFYDGKINVMDSSGRLLERFEPTSYLEFIGEHVESWSYLKFPFYKGLGWPAGIYRVGPLARVNICEKISTPIANAELEEFRKIFGRVASPTLAYHYARMIEAIYAIEHAQELVANEKIISANTRAEFKLKGGEGIGVVEAPRGTLIHHYAVDESGNIRAANLIVATVNNNAAMNLALREVAKKYMKGSPTEDFLNKMEMAIRAFDPCLSCATHEIGKMPFVVSVYNGKYKKVHEIVR